MLKISQQFDLMLDPIFQEDQSNHIVAKKNELFDAIQRSSRGRTITHAFNICLPDGELPKVRGGSDATSATWIPLSQVDSAQTFEDHYEIISYFTGV